MKHQKKAKLTLDEHRIIGKKLFDMREIVIGLLMQISHAYNKPQAKPVKRLLSAIDDLRNKLDNQLCLDYPDEFETRIYYPGSKAGKSKLLLGVCLASIELDSQAFTSGSYEGGYRRGVSHGLNTAANIVGAGGGHDDLCWLVDESMVMRYDRQPHPTYTDDLRRRYRDKKGREKVLKMSGFDQRKQDK